MTTSSFAPRAGVRAALLLMFACALPCALAPAASAQNAPAAAAGAAERAFSRTAPVPAWVEPITTIPAAPAGHALSMRLSDVQFRVGAEQEEYHHKAIAAHEASSLGALGQFDIAFQPDYQRVRLHRLVLLRGRQAIDKLASADIRFLQRERGLEQGVYTGSVTAQIVTTDVRVGDTLEIAYTISGQNPVFGGHVMESAQIDTSVPVQLRRITFDAPESTVVEARLLGRGGAAPVQTVQMRDGRRRMRFELANLAAVIGEPGVPFDAHQYRWLQFSDFGGWAAVNDWALDLFSAQTPAAVLAAPLRSARAAKTREEQVARVLDYVQNEIRYLSVSLGENSHRPFAPAIVLERGYGDCKDKTLLMVTMLRALGIEAAPVLVATYATRGLAQLLPSPTLFDHAIVQVSVNGKQYFLDPTRLGQVGALDRMGQAHAGREVLVVRPGSAALETIAQPARELALNKRTERAVVAEFGKAAEFHTRVDAVGVEAETLRVQLARMSKQELRKSYEGALVKRYPDARLLVDPVVSDDRARNTLRIENRYSVPGLLEASADGGWDLEYTPVNLTELFADSGSAQRRHPLEVPAFPYGFEYQLELTLPAGATLPVNQFRKAVEDQAFVLKRTLETGPRAMRVHLALEMRDDRVAPGRIVHYLKNLQQLREMLGSNLHVPAPGALAAATPAPAAPLDGPARLEQALSGIGQAIADADALGRDPGAALCERAQTLAWLGRKAEALKDIARALALQPQSTALLRCRADVNFTVGRFKESEADYGRAIARGDTGAGAWLGRAMALLYQNRQAAAAPDFQAAAAKADEGADRVRAQIWQQLAGAPAAIDADADSAAPGWLLAARTLFAGGGEAESMISQAMRDVPAQHQGQLVEAYFYAGRYHLAKGNPLKARVYFQRALDKKLLDNAYHVAARHELARM